MGYIWVQLTSFHIICCYKSPNVQLNEYKNYIDEVMRNVKRSDKVVIVGDLNAKSREWGSPVEDERGRHLAEWMSALDIIAINDGKVPTFQRGNSASFIDVTLATSTAARDIRNWAVLEEESPFNHRFIYYEITERHVKQQNMWEKPILDKSKLKDVIEREMRDCEISTIDTVKNLTSILDKVYKNSCVQRRKLNSHMPYWWNAEIENKRSECISTRRNNVREFKRPNLDEDTRNRLRVQYRTKKKELNTLIKAAKKNHWRDICEELNSDIWGDGYKIATRHLKNFGAPYALEKEEKIRIARELFPSMEEEPLRKDETEQPEPFEERELIDAAGRMKDGKAPGPDGIPPEVIKEVARIIPNRILKTLNELLRQQEFPADWKTARLVLISKGNTQTEDPSAHRPLCLLNTGGKLYEAMILARLEKELERHGGLSGNQHGFRKGHSTIQAMQCVIERKRNTTERWCALITLDVKNAFNTATWSLIIRELRRRDIPNYLINLVISYFDNRKLLVTGNKELGITAGVPQGSVLGPTLWNVLYDGVLRLGIPEGAQLIGYADDLALVVTAPNEHKQTL